MGNKKKILGYMRKWQIGQMIICFDINITNNDHF